jgi:hypothetical protein
MIKLINDSPLNLLPQSKASGKIALYGVETNEYQSFLDNPALEISKAMRSSKK